MGRREFIMGIAGGLLAAPHGAGAPGRMWQVGYLGGGSRERLAPFVGALEGGLRDLGYVERQNIAFQHRAWRWSGRLARVRSPPPLTMGVARTRSITISC